MNETQRRAVSRRSGAGPWVGCFRNGAGAAAVAAVLLLAGIFSVPVAAQPFVAEISANQTCGPAPLNVCFSATAPDLDPEALPWTYTWDFGDGTFPTPNFQDPRPCHAFMAPGTQYNVTVTIQDMNGDTAVGAILISTQELAVNICATPTSGPAPLLVQFNDGCGNVSGGIPPYAYDWDFGDGSDHCFDWATQHAYANPGTYYVTLKVTDSCAPATVVTDTHIVITVTQLNVTGNATATRTCGPPGTEVCFTGTAQGGSPPYTFTWNFGDGSAPGSGVAPCHTYAAAGTYPVTLTVMDSVGHTFSDTHLTVIITPPLSVTASASRTEGFAPLTVYFTSSVAGGTGPYSYLWDFGDGESATTGNALHTYASPGTYEVLLTVTDSCVPAAAASATPIVVGVYPIQVTATVNRPCGYAPLNVIFDATAVGGLPPYSYAWNFGDGTPGDTIANPSHSYLAVGDYTAVVTVTDSAGRTGTASVAVHVVPVLTVQALGDPATVGPAPLTVNVRSVVAGGLPPYTYDWDFGDGEPHSVADHDQHTWIAVGTYTCVLTVTDSCGNKATAELPINAYGPVTPSITASSSCATAPVNVCFQAGATGGLPPYTYAWNFGDGGTSSNPTPCHNYLSPGNYTVTLTATDSLAHSGTATLTVQVVAPLNLTVVAGASATLGLPPLAVNFNASVGGASPPFTYAWDFGDGQSSTDAAPQHLYTDAGTYPVSLTVTATDACGKVYTAVDNHLTITVAQVPSIVLTSPVDGGTYGGTVPLSATVLDDAAVVRVEYYVNGQLLGWSSAGPSYSVVWNSAGLSGTYTVNAKVVDALSRTATSASATVTLANPRLDGRVQALSGPFRLKVYGSGFQPGCVVKINGVNAPLTEYKGSTLLQVKGGALLKAMLPKGVPVLVTVVNPDGGLSNSASFAR